MFMPFLPMRSFWRTPNTGGDGGDSGTDDQVADPPKGDGSKPAERTFTQADVDKLTGDARKGGREAALKSLLGEVGLEDADKLKAFVADARKTQEAQMTEAEKQKAEMEKLRQETETAKTERTRAVATANERLMQAAVLTEAAKAEHKVNPAALADVWLFVDRATLEVGEDGVVKGAQEAVQAVIKARAYLTQTALPRGGTPLREKRPNGAGTEDKRVPTVSRL